MSRNIKYIQAGDFKSATSLNLNILATTRSMCSTNSAHKTIEFFLRCPLNANAV
uniref:Uncharacterized protein n=1 Tax=Lepeophtheirus salmonis TaxID=72036 RepID=A0A0K2TPT0_LEPSM